MKSAVLVLFAVVATQAAWGQHTPGIELYHLASSRSRQPVSVLFIPGDGGWRGMAVKMAQNIAGWGYDVYGLDTKRYLEAFNRRPEKLTADQMSADLAEFARRPGGGRSSVIIVGWSQGACMAVLAAARKETKPYIKGIVTLGLPEYGVLGWNWKDTLSMAAGRPPEEPRFYVKDYLPHINPIPLFAIYGTNDDYTPPANERQMLSMVGRPMQLRLIEGANHRFDGHLDALFETLAEALRWVQQD
ncbi:MAG TPA: alpha/beta fold hydrolase [Bryobacteraceae bacterium]|nr:alpha/beta fold hydrolase [Bryobacteraceae bacterium]